MKLSQLSFCLSTEAGRYTLSRLGVLALLFLILGAAAYVVSKYLLSRLLRRLFNIPLTLPPLRRVRLAGVVLAVYAVALLYAFLIEPNWVRLYVVDITTPKLHKGDSLIVAHLSDLHWEVGASVRGQKAIEILRRVHPDLIVMTGDYTNDIQPDTVRSLSEFARRLARVAPAIAVVGNWDTPEGLAALRSGGVKVMVNNGYALHKGRSSVKVAAMDYNCAQMLKQMVQRQSPACQIVLAHTPGLFEDAAKCGADLFLCGHTHGGQVRLPVYGTLCPEYNLVGKYQCGLYKSGGTAMYINPGLGLEGGAPKIRFLCRPEVTVIRLKGAD